MGQLLVQASEKEMLVSQPLLEALGMGERAYAHL